MIIICCVQWLTAAIGTLAVVAIVLFVVVVVVVKGFVCAEWEEWEWKFHVYWSFERETATRASLFLNFPFSR